jgi:hypothetical protein
MRDVPIIAPHRYSLDATLSRITADMRARTAVSAAVMDAVKGYVAGEDCYPEQVERAPCR